MAFSILHILDVHIAPDCHMDFPSVLIIDTGLIVCCATEEPCAVWVKGKRVHRVSLEGLVFSHRLELAVHSWKVPNLEDVIETACEHTVAVAVDINSLDCFRVTLEYDLITYGEKLSSLILFLFYLFSHA